MALEETEPTGGAREVAELNIHYAAYTKAREAEQKRHAQEVAALDAGVSRLLTDYLEALTSKSADMASSAVVSLITPMLNEIKTMHAELLTMQTKLKEQYDLLMKTRAMGNNSRMIIDDHGRRLDEQEKDAE